MGGYGRGELAPHSDLDLLFLLPINLKKDEIKKTEAVIQQILYVLWDLGYKVGHSTRTIDDCIEKSKLDLTISTSILERRFVFGNVEIYNLLNKKFGFSELSMGMSSDYILACQNSSTFLRIGSNIFGNRT